MRWFAGQPLIAVRIRLSTSWTTKRGPSIPEASQTKRSRSGRTWGGSGGRWLVWAFRGIAWAVLLLIGYRGVVAILSNESSSGQSAPVASAPAASGFPVTLADAYAEQFGQVYLNYNPHDAGQRAAHLGAFLPSGADPQLGWNGQGTSVLQSEQVATTDVQDAHHAVVTLLARVNGQLMQLGVPVYASSDGLVVSSAPAWLPAPGRATLPTPANTGSDSATQAVLTSQLPAFFQAYASGNQVTLGRFLAQGTTLTGLEGAVDYHSIAAISVPPGGTTRHIIATVVWSVPARTATGQIAKGGAAAQLQMSYALTVVKQNGTWYVKDISAATESPGPP